MPIGHFSQTGGRLVLIVWRFTTPLGLARIAFAAPSPTLTWGASPVVTAAVTREFTQWLPVEMGA